MKTKQRMQMEIKEISANGTFEGLLSPYGNVDQGGDIVEPGAYTKTLQEKGIKRPLLWQHKTDEPIGEMTLEDRPEGLWARGELLLELPEAKKAYLLMKARIVKGLSIGYEAVKDTVEGGVRRLKEIKLYEGSVVTFPMNEMALITTIKGLQTKDDFNEELAETQLMDAGYQMQCALSCSLSSIVYASDMSKEDKITAAEATIQQFAEAYLAYIPAYLDLLAEMMGGMELMGKRLMDVKAGRRVSAATKQTLASAHEHMKSATDILTALLQEEAGDDPTSEPKAATEIEVKTEPDQDHSAALETVNNFLKEIRSWSH